MNAKTVSRMIVLTALAATILLSLPLAGGFFGRLHPAFDSLAHFRLHLAILLILAALPLLLARSFRRNGLLAAAFGAAALVTVTGTSTLPGLGPVHAAFQVKDETSPVYRLMQLNLRFDNPQAGQVLSLIGRIRPDVVTLNEVSGMWNEKLALLSSAYPHRIVCTLDSRAGGVAILSLRPFAQGTDGRCLAGGIFATATVDLGGRPVEVGALHLHWPWPFDQARQIEDLAPLLASMAATAILAGDLNATPWSAASERIADAAGMTPAGPSQPTWLHRRLPEFLRFAGLPIDRIFANGDVVIHSVDTLEAVGSDHLPVLVEFSLRAADPETGDPQTATAALID
ncbi:endonuclease/exonuclease/phosphatase family protein [Mesorhizobium sp. KR9-304]|uniref:endonuclease/exonuclease/phosphatase family protein n=1 Tax=Mesorhizobium sp. KR9-304 TaxID=3156614 RepID=UPI0032B58990